MYDRQKDKTASDIRESYEAIDVAAHYAEQRKTLVAARAQERSVVRDATLYDLDTAMFELARLSHAGKSIDAVLMPFGAAALPPLDPLAGAGESRVPDEAAARENEPTRRARALGLRSRAGLAEAVRTLVQLGLIPEARSQEVVESEVADVQRLVGGIAPDAQVDCRHVVETEPEAAADAAGVAAAERVRFIAFYQELIEECRDALAPLLAARAWLEGRTPAVGPTAALDQSGEIALAYRQWQQALALSRDLRNGRSKAQAALRQLEAEVAATPAAFDIEAVKVRAEQLRKALAAAGKGAGGLGIDLGITAGQLEAVDALLEAAIAGEVPADTGSRSPQLTRALILSASLQYIGADVSALVDALSTPEGRVAVLLESERLRLKRDYLGERAALVDRRAEAGRARVVALLLEARHYHDIAAFLSNRAVPLDQTILAVLDGRDQNAKFGLYGALEAYAAALGSARLRADEAFYDRIDVAQRETILANEFAVRQWDGLVRVPLERIAAYHAAGVKPETIAQLGIMLGQLGLLGYVAVKEAN